jgi:disulfide bond formation protein DsbB
MVIMLSLGISALAILHNPKSWGQKVYSLFNSAILIVGLGLSARHLYLQSLPADQIPECLPGFDYLIKNFPPTEVIKLLFQGSGQCAQVGARFIGLSLSQWSLIAFVVLFLWNLAPLVGMLKLTSKNTSL